MTNTTAYRGGEDMDFVCPALPIPVTTTAGRFRGAPYSRCAVVVSGNSNTNYLETDTPFSLSSFYTSAYLSPLLVAGQNVFVASIAASFLMRWKDAGGVVRFLIAPPTTFPASGGTSFGAQTWAFYKQSAAGVLTQLGLPFTLLASLGTLLKLDTNIVVAAGSAGAINIYANGGTTPLFSFAGDTTTDGGPPIAAVDFGNIGGDSASSGTSNASCAWSECIVASVDTRLYSLRIAPPAALGVTAQWAGGVGTINEVTVNDATGISTTVSGQIEELTLPAIALSGETIVDVAVGARAFTQAGAPQSLRTGINLGGVDYYGATGALDDTPTRTIAAFSLNPATAVAFAPADIVAGALGAAIQSQP